MKCDRCGTENVTPKTIISKKPDTYGQKFQVMECQNGCKQGRYKYSFFPPKETPVPTPNKSNATLSELIEIKRILIDINNKLGGKMHIGGSELKPDENFNAEIGESF